MKHSERNEIAFILYSQTMEFDLTDVPNLSGKTFVVTGASSGVGKESARVLAGNGAFVILACRDVNKAESVVEEIGKSQRGGGLAVVELDLSRLKSVRQCVREIKSRFKRIDVLLNNAATIETESRLETEDGFEVSPLRNVAVQFRRFHVIYDVSSSWE